MSEGDSLRGLVIRYRAAHEVWRGHEARRYEEHKSEKAALLAAERHGAATGLKINLEDQILKRLREDGDAILDMLQEYGK